jgi:AraC-like DNA-binding protein
MCSTSSPKYLAEAVETTGKSPHDHQRVLLLECKVQMGSTNKSITEIAHELQLRTRLISAASFRQHTGLTH